MGILDKKNRCTNFRIADLIFYICCFLLDIIQCLGEKEAHVDNLELFIANRKFLIVQSALMV